MKKKISNKRKTSKAERQKLLHILASILAISFLLVILRNNLTGGNLNGRRPGSQNGGAGRAPSIEKPEIKEDFLTKNKYSRPGKILRKVDGIVVHYVANPGSTAQDNRDYFEGLAKTKERKASSHFLIGLDGEIIQCIPLKEMAYCSNEANTHTISVECCHPKKDGKFSDKTYASLVDLVSWLCDTYGLTEEDVIRHYDVTGKICPKYFVDHPDSWDSFREDIKSRLANQ
ncbi:MAG: N-acetylmuramoyl-L-alanine amidase [Oscillospiraceae bacterium]|nr:N-acetylmuramoyl-L-alanine amidase [Oscillospiraceae bacterium]